MTDRQQEAILTRDLTQRAPEQQSPSLEHQHAFIRPPSYKYVCVCLYVCVQAASLSWSRITAQSLLLW